MHCYDCDETDIHKLKKKINKYSSIIRRKWKAFRFGTGQIWFNQQLSASLWAAGSVSSPPCFIRLSLSPVSVMLFSQDRVTIVFSIFLLHPVSPILFIPIEIFPFKLFLWFLTKSNIVWLFLDNIFYFRNLFSTYCAPSCILYLVWIEFLSLLRVIIAAYCQCKCMSRNLKSCESAETCI